MGNSRVCSTFSPGSCVLIEYSPSIVDLHSHIGVGSLPRLSGASDTNSRSGIVQPWLRSLDGLNTHDDSYKLSVAGGVTTALVLPGSANDIGGQAFAIKIRPTQERTATAMVIEPPFTLNSTDSVDWALPPRWRHMKYSSFSWLEPLRSSDK